MGSARWEVAVGIYTRFKVLLDDPECVAMMTTFIEEHPELWNEDIGVD